MKKKDGIGCVIGRFQVPVLHAGHKYVIDHAAKHERLAIFVGCHPMLVTKASPLDFPTRKRMLEAAYPDAHVVALPDQPTDQGWSDTLDMLLRVHLPIGDPVHLYGSRDSFAPHYHGRFKVVELDPLDGDWSGTNVREEVKVKPLSSSDFRHGVIYAAMNQFGRTRLCVDIALVKFAEGEVLLGQKPNHPGRWRFPGGFVDGKDDSTEMAARRELQEETGLNSEGPLQFLGGFRIKDWRDTPSDRCFSNFYRADYTFGMAKGSDDLPVVGWHKISSLRDLPMAGDHVMLAEKLIEHMGRSCS